MVGGRLNKYKPFLLNKGKSKINNLQSLDQPLNFCLKIMPYYQNPEKIPTLLEALNNTNVDQLKSLLSLLPVTDIPKRKAELVAATYRALQGDTLGKLWTELDELQQAAISEVVYSNSSQFEGQQFKAKYGKLPNFDILGEYYKKGYPT